MTTGVIRNSTVQQKLIEYLKRCTRTSNRCLIWPGAASGYGYPVANMHGRSGKMSYLHREIYKACVGIIPDDWVVDHICENRLCLNPDHLRILTFDDNKARGAWTNCMPVYIFLQELDKDDDDVPF